MEKLVEMAEGYKDEEIDHLRQTVTKLSSKEYAKTTAKKRADTAKGKQFSKQPKGIASKVKRYR